MNLGRIKPKPSSLDISKEFATYSTGKQSFASRNKSSILRNVINWNRDTIKTLVIILFFLLSTAVYLVSSNDQQYCKENGLNLNDIDSYFRAATFEHRRIDLESITDTVEANLDVFKKVARLAATNGADILVLPEDGIFDGPLTRVHKVLEDIPDPELYLNSIHSNPCTQPDLFPYQNILKKLSCIARENGLYLVANYGTKAKCEPGSIVGKFKCPDSGEFAFNTDVVFNSEGKFIKRYRKWNIFIETFDRATDIETVYFDSPHGRFGIFTCFDIMFKRPAIELVNNYEVDTILFPTWWYDEFPLLTAIQFQNAWSSINGVNLIASNIQNRDLGSIGSGIYSSTGSKVYTSPGDVQPKLIIANLPKRRVRNRVDSTTGCDRQEFKPQVIELATDRPIPEYQHSNMKLLRSDLIHVLDDNVMEANLTQCNNEVCCTIDYKMNQRHHNSIKEALVLIVRDSLRNGTFRWYEQICALAGVDRTTLSKDSSVRSQFYATPLANFERLSLRATFNSKSVYPIASHTMDRLFDSIDQRYDCKEMDLYLDNKMYECRLEIVPKENGQDISVFGLYGRVYERDQIDYMKKITKNWKY